MSWTYLMILYFCSVATVMIDSRDSIGTAKDSSCFISDLKMADYDGHGIVMMPSN